MNLHYTLFDPTKNITALVSTPVPTENRPAAAALFCNEEGISPDETRAVSLRVSGTPGPVAVEVTAASEKAFTCTVMMPPPERITEETLPFQGKTYTLHAVYFPGIAHLILPWDALDKTAAEAAVKQWCEALNVKGLGLMLLKRNLSPCARWCISPQRIRCTGSIPAPPAPRPWERTSRKRKVK